MNGEVNDNDYIGGGTPVNNIINQQPPQHQQQHQQQPHQQQVPVHPQSQQGYPQQYQYPQGYPQGPQGQQGYPQGYQGHLHYNTNDVVYEYTNCKLMEIVLVFVLFICLTNCILYNLQKQFLPTNLYSRYNHPPWILVFINAIIFIIIYILLQKYAFN